MKTSVLLHTRHDAVQPEPRLLFCRVRLKQRPLNSKPLLPPLTPSLRQPSFYQYFSFSEGQRLVLHTSGIIQYLSSCDWLISLSIVSSGFVHVIAHVRMSSRLSNIPLMYLPHVVNPFILGGHVHCFRLLAIRNSAVMNMGMQIFHRDPAKSWRSIILLSRYPEVRVLSQAVILS